MADNIEYHHGMGIRILSAAESAKEDLGPLTKLRGTWKGKPFDGWNVISVPGPKPDGFVLEVIPYEETLNFDKVVVLADNRGPFDPDGTEQTQQIVGLMYEQIIRSVCTTDLCKQRGFGDGSMIHAERGFFLWIKNPNQKANPNPQFNIIRLSTIPHGNSVLALGQNFESTAPIKNDFIQPNSIQPTKLDGSTILGYGEDQFDKQQDPGFDQSNPNSFLIKTLGSEKITAMTTLVLSSTNPDGGILNIPFIQQNIKTTKLDCIFWIETIEDANGKHHDQLQYTQTINLVFPPTGLAEPIIWPHVTINTMRKV